MVGRVLSERRLESIIEWFAQADADSSQVGSDADAGGFQNGPRQIVKGSQELSRLETEVIMPSFKAVQFLDHRDGDDHIVGSETLNAFGIVQDDIGIENEDLFNQQ